MVPGHIPALLTLLPQAKGMSEAVNGSLSTHVLNTTTGLPAAGLALSLALLQEPGPQWMELVQR